jgi:hypothetical protein
MQDWNTQKQVPTESASMHANPMPNNEIQRLVALEQYQILDTPKEAVFDLYASLTAAVFRVPIAIVGLIDQHRHWFKATVGVNLTSNSRSNAFCAHTIVQDAVLSVPDATFDDRFSRNPVVTDTGVRFYAGAPLRTHEGYRIGTLCVFDMRPRQWSDRDSDLLAQLAALVMAELERRLDPLHHTQHESAVAALTRVSADVADRLGLQASALLAAKPAVVHEPQPSVRSDPDQDPNHQETIHLLASTVQQFDPPKALKLKVLERLRFNRRFADTFAPAQVLRWADGCWLVLHALELQGAAWRVWTIGSNGQKSPLATATGQAVLVTVPVNTRALAISRDDNAGIFLAFGVLELN